jgi:transposase
MNLPIRIGMDTSKSVFQVHGVDENEVVVVRRQFRRAEMIRYFERLSPVLVAIESCGSSHHWARLLQSFGHEVKLIPPQYVKAYVKRGKNDAADAEALCEAVTRPSMRFVPVKSKERQAACMLMTVRERLVNVKSQLSNAFRSYAAEFGIIGPAGRQNVTALIKRVLEDDNLPEMARDLFRLQAEEYAAVEARLAKVEAKLMKWHREDDVSRRVATIPGVGPIGSSSVRKGKEGETTNDLYAFLTTEPNAEVGAIHPKAMPVILTTPDEVETWITAPADEALKLQRPLPDGALRIVARGVKEDTVG